MSNVKPHRVPGHQSYANHLRLRISPVRAFPHQNPYGKITQANVRIAPWSSLSEPLNPPRAGGLHSILSIPFRLFTPVALCTSKPASRRTLSPYKPILENQSRSDVQPTEPGGRPSPGRALLFSIRS